MEVRSAPARLRAILLDHDGAVHPAAGRSVDLAVVLDRSGRAEGDREAGTGVDVSRVERTARAGVVETVWATPSWFTQVTTVPALTVRVVGLKAVFCMKTWFGPGVLPPPPP